MAEETTLQIIGILIAGAGLLGWLIKIIIVFFINQSKERSKYIEQLVDQNQKNTVSFVNTINHQRTLDREMQSKHLKTIQKLTEEIKISNEVNRRMLDLLKKSNE